MTFVLRTVMVKAMIGIDVNNKKNYKAKVDIGSKSKSFLSELDSLQKNKFMDEIAVPFYVACSGYMLKNLPLKNQLLIDVKYLHPTLHDKDSGINAIPRLANLVVSCLGESFQVYFRWIKKSQGMN